MGNSNIYGSSRGGLPRRGWKGTARGMRTQRKEACTPKVTGSKCSGHVTEALSGHLWSTYYGPRAGVTNE